MLISIIVPIYNAEKYLSDCLESVINQIYQEIEIILVDDGSTDRSLEICRDYAQLDTRIKIESKSHQGLVMARKWGVETSKGNYCMFVDSDDWIDERLLETMIPIVQNENIDIVSYLLKSVDGNTVFEWKNTVPEGIYENENRNAIFNRMMFDFEHGCPGIVQSLCTKLIRRELLIHSFKNLDSRITIGEDAAVTYKALLMAKKIAVINHSFYYYRIHQNSMYRTKDEFIFSRIYYFQEYMKNIFVEYNQTYGLYKQLNAYIMHFIEKGMDDLFSLKINELNRIPDSLCTEISGKIILYGAGNVGKKYYRQLQCMRNVEIVAWVDQALKNQLINRCRIDSPEIVKKVYFDKILIAVKDENIAEDIKKILEKYTEKRKILWEKPGNIEEKEIILKE